MVVVFTPYFAPMANYQNLENYGGYAGSSDYDSQYDPDQHGPNYDPRYANYPSREQSASSSSGAGSVLLAAVVGAAAGAVVGLLLAPDKGSNTVASLRSSARPYADQLQGALKKYLDKVETKLADAGLTGAGSRLQLKGNWNDLKGQLKQQYGDLTDEDLTYAEGASDELVGNIQRRLGKTKREVVDLLNNLG